ncbi:hypothetical protein [Streptomyces capoamus]|uniref:hypothetical protein n=1 Tax=Streptomyces capoamus TaxID=68183 RepID=UPI0033967E0B
MQAVCPAAPLAKVGAPQRRGEYHRLLLLLLLLLAGAGMPGGEQLLGSYPGSPG